MGHSYYLNTYHIIFATKTREASLNNELQLRLYPYMSALINQQFGFTRILNGTDNHIHILCDIPPKHAISNILRQLKSETTKWVNREKIIACKFSWQEGFSCFSVSRSQIDAVYKYIEHQKEHHKHITFQEEYQLFLQRCSISCFDDEFE